MPEDVANNAYLILSEKQTETFDSENHSEQELAQKLLRFHRLFGDAPFHILDIGGGNGNFVDSVLERFPNSRATLVDSSQGLLARNIRHDRKELIHGPIEQLEQMFKGRSFDCISFNWVLHHLVGDSYAKCQDNSLNTLRACQGLLSPDGMLVVTENMFDGFFGTDMPSRIIYGLTSMRHPWAMKLIGKFFNTAGIGVCFHSNKAWRALFKKAGYQFSEFIPGSVWYRRRSHKIAFPLLLLKPVAHGHYFLKRAAR